MVPLRDLKGCYKGFRVLRIAVRETFKGRGGEGGGVRHPSSYLWLVGNGGMGYNYNYYYYHSSIPY